LSLDGSCVTGGAANALADTRTTASVERTLRMDEFMA
jgi:hypothetical protein